MYNSSNLAARKDDFDMKKYAVTLCVILSVFLSACSRHALRNRSFDYLDAPVAQAAPLVVPPGMKAPKTEPYQTLPPGPNSYPAGASVSLQPPGFSEPATALLPSSPAPKAVETPVKSAPPVLAPSAEQLKSQLDLAQKQVMNLETNLEEFKQSRSKVQ